ncbi:MAG: small multi-drug export protein [Planifilum fulgidum]
MEELRVLIESLEEGAYIALFLLSAVPWVEVSVVPIGILMGLHPISVAILGFLGNWITVFLLILLFDRWNQWRKRRKPSRAGASEEAPSKRRQRARRLWERFGLVGLALLSPLATGTHLAAAVAMAFRTPKGKVTLWMTVSIFLWTTLLAAGSHYGFEWAIPQGT